jgi:hypothetical protein
MMAWEERSATVWVGRRSVWFEEGRMGKRSKRDV